MFDHGCPGYIVGEAKNEQGKAGQFYAKCGQYMKALNLYLDCGEREMDRAIEVVGKARSDMLTHTLVDYLMVTTTRVFAVIVTAQEEGCVDMTIIDMPARLPAGSWISKPDATTVPSSN